MNNEVNVPTEDRIVQLETERDLWKSRYLRIIRALALQAAESSTEVGKPQGEDAPDV